MSIKDEISIPMQLTICLVANVFIYIDYISFGKDKSYGHNSNTFPIRGHFNDEILSYFDFLYRSQYIPLLILRALFIVYNYNNRIKSNSLIRINIDGSVYSSRKFLQLLQNFHNLVE